MNREIFTVEEENLACIFDTGSRAALIAGLGEAMLEFDEPELREIAESAMRKLNAMTDAVFSGLVFSPAYYDNETEV